MLSLTSNPGKRQQVSYPLSNCASSLLRSGFWLLAFLRSLKLSHREAEPRGVSTPLTSVPSVHLWNLTQ